MSDRVSSRLLSAYRCSLCRDLQGQPSVHLEDDPRFEKDKASRVGDEYLVMAVTIGAEKRAA